MGEEIGGWRLGGMTRGADGGGVGEGNVDKRDKWKQAARNFSPVRRLSLRVRGLLSCQARDPGLRARGGSFLSSSEGKKSNDGWFLEILSGDSGCKGSC